METEGSACIFRHTLSLIKTGQRLVMRMSITTPIQLKCIILTKLNLPTINYLLLHIFAVHPYIRSIHIIGRLLQQRASTWKHPRVPLNLLFINKPAVMARPAISGIDREDNAVIGPREQSTRQNRILMRRPIWVNNSQLDLVYLHFYCTFCNEGYYWFLSRTF